MGSGHLNKREGFAKFTLSWYFPFMLLFAAMLIIHLVITPGTKDDTVYITHLANQSAWQYLSGDYHAWSSR
ncbi:MAG: hypothetical protein RR244_08925, partial [Oscillospiraceae bacterium]